MVTHKTQYGNASRIAAAMARILIPSPRSLSYQAMFAVPPKIGSIMIRAEMDIQNRVELRKD